MNTGINIRKAETEHDFHVSGTMFREYYQGIADEYRHRIKLDELFEGFEEDLSQIDRIFAPPLGAILLIQNASREFLGSVGIKKLEKGICELKRMYIRSPHRGKGLGKPLLQKAIEVARELNYSKMRLDSLPTMKAALAIYRDAGFYPIQPYKHNPVKGTTFMEIQLNPGKNLK